MDISDITLDRILSLINNDELDEVSAKRLYNAYTRTRTGTPTGKTRETT